MKISNCTCALPLLLFYGLCLGPVSAGAQTRLQANPSQLTLGFLYGVGPDSGNPSSFTVTTPGIGFTAAVQTFSAAYGGWLSVSPASGSTSQPITISLKAANLPVGKYLATVTLSFKGNYAPLIVPVWVSVHDILQRDNIIVNGFGFTSEPVFDFTQGQIPAGCEIGSNSAACTAGIDDLGASGAGTPFQLTSVTLDGGTWLGLGESSGVTPSTSVFTIDPTQIPVGVGQATGYVVVDGGTRGIDYVTVTIPALQGSSTFSASSLAALAATVSPRRMAIGYLDAGNGSQTTIHLVNTGAQIASYQLQFWQTDPNSGQVAPLFVTMANGSKATQASGTVAPGGAALIDTSVTASNEAIGWAELTTTSSLSGYGVLNQSGPNQVSASSEYVESAMPFTPADRTLLMPYDNTGLGVTQVLLVNPSQSVTSVTLNFRDASANPLGNGPQYVVLGPNNQTLLTLPVAYPNTAGLAGIIELDGYSPISAVGIRSEAGGAFSYIPAFGVLPAQPTTTLPLIVYGGPWQSTITQFNPQSSVAGTSLAFYAPMSPTTASGVSLDAGFLNLPGNTTLSPQIPAGGVNVLQSAVRGTSTQLAWMSSGASSSSQAGNGMELLRLDSGGAVSAFSTNLAMTAPFQDRAIFPFDNTDGFSSLLFLANADVTGSGTFTVQVNDENGNPLTSFGPGSVSAHQVASVSFQSGVRGTVTVTAVGHGFYGTLFRYSSGSAFTTLPGFQGPTGQ